MDRFRPKSARAVALCAAVLISAAGCNMIATALYVVQGANLKAEFDKLKGKRVAVVCRPVTSLQYRDFNAPKDLAKQVGELLKENVSKVRIVDQREIAEWADEKDWEDYLELGEAVNADIVIGLDLEEFSLYEDQTLFRGKANLKISVYDVKAGGDPVWEKPLPEVQYPPNTPLPVDKPEAQFRREFVRELAERIARHFYDHDATVEFASDSAAVK
jgi:hypothetical protein